jgi:mutator protein MutT
VPRANNASKPHIHVTAGLIAKDGKLLITKRPPGGDLVGFWEFPGGKQEQDETLARCLEREILEEVGIKIRADEAFLTVLHEYETKVVSLHVFHCTLLEGDPQTIECQDFRWVRPSEFCQFEFPPPDIRVIEALTRDLCG